jgi:pyruvate carboxylase subunit B
VTDTTLSGVPGLMSIVIDGKPTQAYVARDGRDYRVTVEGRTFLIPTAGGGKRGRSSVGGASDPPGQVTAPLAGVVVEVRVAAGDAVEASQTLLVIEAMKMQNEIQVPTAGTITTIHCTAGERVEKGDLLVDYEPAEE